MREDTGSGRVFFVEGQSNITPSSVANQVVSTGMAQVNQVERQKRQKMEDLQTIRDSALQIMKTSQTEQEKANQRNLLSASTTIDKLKIDYQNQVAEGGLIDRQNIPFNEKLRLKQEALDKLTSGLNETKTYLESNKGVLQSILGTEQAYTRSLDIIQNQTQQALNEAQNNIIAEAQRMEKTTTIENLKNISSSITNANTEKQANNIATLSVQRINEAEKQGIITPAEATVLRNNLSNSFNNRAVDIRLNNAWDKVARGDIEGARKDIEIAYDLTRKGKAFNTSFSEDGSYVADQVGNETKLRNFLLQLDKMETSEKVYQEHEIQNNISLEEVIEQATKDLPPEKHEEAIKEITTLYGNKNNLASAEFDYNILRQMQQKGEISLNVDISDPKVISNFQKENGQTFRSALTPKRAEAFKVGFNQIGLPRNKIVNGKDVPVSNVEQMKEFIDYYKNNLGSMDALEKEAGYHLGTEGALLIKGLKRGHTLDQYADIINKVIVPQNTGTFAISEDTKLDKDFLDQFLKTPEGKYLEETGQRAKAQKIAKGLRVIAEATGETKASNVANRFSGTSDYIATSNKNIEFDNTLYKKSDIEKSINVVFANSKDYLNLNNKYKIDAKDIIKAETTIAGEVDFYVYPQNGNPKFSIGSIPFDKLPKPPTAEEQKAQDYKRQQTAIAEKELKQRENWKNIKANVKALATGEGAKAPTEEELRAEGIRKREAIKQEVSNIASNVVLANSNIRSNISNVASKGIEVFKRLLNEPSVFEETIKKSDEELQNIVKNNKK